MIRLAGQHADELVLNLASPARVAQVRSALDIAASAANRPAPRLTVWVPVALEAKDAAHAQLAGQVAVYLAPPGYGEMFSALGFDDLVVKARSGATRRDLAAAIPVELLDSVSALGSAARIAARLRAYREAGADCIAVVPSTAEDPGGRATLSSVRRSES
jgi:alkanesulfonate monooxygenase SsuD/methylene tetrahydromethanopterin reductase-like flavin-dependent oxidoreductase (luciferase family)